MAKPEKTDFIAGVIEGFYGEPWTQAERFELFERMAAWGLNTYFYAPKDDLRHRALWREMYPAPEAEKLGEAIQSCKARGIRFIFGLGPGLDIRYSDEADLNRLRQRLEQMRVLGCQDFALLFDDIPDRMDPDDARRFSSFASAQCHVTNTLLHWMRKRCPEVRVYFCPTAYCSRMAEAGLGGVGYLSIIGCELSTEIEVFWTGPEIISREITVTHVGEIQNVLRRKPLIWDNLHANDYDGRRFYCGPYSGRPTELRNLVSGILSNPNNEFPLNYVPLRTLAEFVRCEGPWDARKAYLSAMQEWLPYFATAGEAATLEELILLGDCYYLPHEEGPEAEALYGDARALVSRNSEILSDELAAFRRRSGSLQAFCIRLTGLLQRRLFYALSRRIWELREELDFLDRYAAFRVAGGLSHDHFNSQAHLAGTYRGGIVPRLQRLLTRRTDGGFSPAEDVAARHESAYIEPRIISAS